MGGGVYREDVYRANVGRSVASGQSMAFSRSIERGERKAAAHTLLDPKGRNQAGQQIRECRDSEEHPDVTPIVVAFDLTGSNKVVAQLSQEKLPMLYNMLQSKGICADPAICVAGYGDAYCDIVPLQISQFEANNAIDTALDAMYIEGGGGGNGGETATLLWYFLNTFAEMDALNNRGKKGYFFMIADECTLRLEPGQIEHFLGRENVPAESLTVEKIAEELQKKFNVFILQVDNGSAREQGARKKYERLFGKNHVLDLVHPEHMVEALSVAIGALEGTLTESNADSVLLESGASSTAIKTALVAASKLFGQRGEIIDAVAPVVMTPDKPKAGNKVIAPNTDLRTIIKV